MIDREPTEWHNCHSVASKLKIKREAYKSTANYFIIWLELDLH